MQAAHIIATVSIATNQMFQDKLVAMITMLGLDPATVLSAADPKAIARMLNKGANDYYDEPLLPKVGYNADTIRCASQPWARARECGESGEREARRGREEETLEGRDEEREGGREGGREDERTRGREKERKRGREEERKRGREEERKRERKGVLGERRVRSACCF